jgi:sensor histidine kinase YesM
MSLTYGGNRRGLKRVLETFLSIAVYTAVFKPLDLVFQSMVLFLLSLFVFGFLYILLFVKGQLPQKALLLITYIYSYICIKSLALSITQTALVSYGITSITVLSLFSYLVQDIALLLVSVFFVRHPLKINTELPQKYWIIMYLCPLILAVVIQYNIAVTDISLNAADRNFVFFIVSAFILVLATYYISYGFMRTHGELLESRFTNQKMLLQADYFERSKNMTEQIRQEKHELKNHYFYLQSLVKQRQYDELERFLSSEICERLNILEEIKTGNDLLDYLLTQKVSEARLLGIGITTSVLIPENLSVSNVDLFGVLCNLLDNAIDASKNEENPDITVSISVMKSYLKIEVRNKCSVNIFEKNPKLKTRKNNSEYHGYGLKVVKRAAKKYDGNFSTEMKDGYFTASVMLMLESE